jgi:hypothetical protein
MTAFGRRADIDVSVRNRKLASVSLTWIKKIGVSAGEECVRRGLIRGPRTAEIGKLRKSNDVENLAKVDFSTSLRLQSSLGPIRRSVVVFA